jgi:glycerol-3-phosphate acyltransferase PlsY
VREAIAVLGGAYLMGSVPFGWLFFRLLHGADIRSVGSGNIGATNLVRASGWGLGLLTLLLDASKGAGAVFLAQLLTGSPFWAAAAALAAVMGHCFPVWLGFRGGKGVATGCGAFSVIHPAAMLVAMGVFALALGASRKVAAGSILASASFPVAAAALGAPPAAALWSGAACLVIVARHRENIQRLLTGEERSLFGSGSGREDR